jgi:hypothetical protein
MEAMDPRLYGFGRRIISGAFAGLVGFTLSASAAGRDLVNLARATIVVRPGTLAPAESMAARVLAEEVEARTGFQWRITNQWPQDGVVIAIASGTNRTGWPNSLQPRLGEALPENQPEGFRLVVQAALEGRGTIWVLGADSRGTLFGVGQLLRSLNWTRGSAALPSDLDIATAPALPIRGHQLGYRATANSYDGWDDKQYEQYIRELALFGANSIEMIPFQDERKSPLMSLPRSVMNRKISEICAQYELDCWIWAPATFDLKDNAKREAFLQENAMLFRDCPRIDGIFFPGGDPGDNSPDLVIAFLADLWKLLSQSHPHARIWLSMQGFEKEQTETVYAWIEDKMPAWLGGLVAGPSSPPIPAMRARLPVRYGLRDYPDITHTVRCQYPVPWWDQGFARTLGREASNPRPVFYKSIQNYFGPYTSGSISYSDGVHDDVNKAIWSRLGWQPEDQPRDILREYTRCFFGAEVADPAADAILALEKNWEGPLAQNGAVDGTLELWLKLEREAPELGRNWRWQLCLLRAYYDAYTRHRLLYEEDLERQATRMLVTESPTGPDAAMEAALKVLQRAVTEPVHPNWRARIEELCAALFDSIKLQTSVEKYHASGPERGAVLDFVALPLNNRWWLEDEFARIGKLSAASEKLEALARIASWSAPGPGSFYDEVGNIARSPHVVRGEGINTDPLMERNPNPTFWWWDGGLSRKRLSWQTSLDWPLALAYHHLDPKTSYRVRLTGYGQALLRANGRLLTPTLNGKEVGELKEFPVPRELLKEGRLRLTFDLPTDEAHLNWRQQSRVSEVWLLKD